MLVSDFKVALNAIMNKPVYSSLLPTIYSIDFHGSVGRTAKITGDSTNLSEFNDVDFIILADLKGTVNTGAEFPTFKKEISALVRSFNKPCHILVLDHRYYDRGLSRNINWYSGIESKRYNLFATS